MPLPPPPVELAVYVGGHSNEDPVSAYLDGGAAYAHHLLAALPAGFALGNARVLDFGCGSGRIMRHMIERQTGAVFEGCDIHRPSIEWFSPLVPRPHAVFLNREEPPLERPDGHYRVIYATSVFTHLGASWARWLLELHRLLEDGGLLLATHIGPGFAGVFGEDPWDEEHIGMLVLGSGNPWEAGGPMVLHSEWWIRAHWGRCFDVLSFERDGFGVPDTPGTQGLIVLRKRDVEVTAAALERIEAAEPREITALAHALARTQEEAITLNEHLFASGEAGARAREAAARATEDAAHAREAAARAREDAVLAGDAVIALQGQLHAANSALAQLRGSRLLRYTRWPRRAWYAARGR